MFYDKVQIGHVSVRFVAFLITNMTDISCLKTEVNLNTMYNLSSFLTESMLLVYYKDQSSAAVNSNLCWIWQSQEACKYSVRARRTFLNVKPDGIYSYHCLKGGPGSSVGIATDYGIHPATDGPGWNPGGDEIFRPSRPALGPTQSPVKCVPALSRG